MDKNGGSRLLQMQARYQQKQLQERELKIASLYEAQQARALDRVRHSPSNGVSANSPPQPPPVSHHPGKVRQMFEERRTKAGIDKSYPLQPIHNTDRPARKPLPNGYTKVSSTSRVSVEKKSTKHTISSHNVVKHHKIENIVNGSGDLNHNHEPNLNSVKLALPNNNGELINSIDEVDRADNNYLLENETFPDALAPIPTPRSPEPEPEPKKPQRRTPAVVAKGSPAKAKPQTPAATPPRKTTSDNAVADSNKARGAMQRGANPVPRRQPVSSSSSTKTRAPSGPATAGASSAGSGVGCTVCGRRFAADRLAKHQEICKKAHAKKRKPFDALKHRLAGTEAEPFINKVRKSQTNPPTTKVTTKTLNSNWRQKHEEFIQAIRAAKQVQAHLNAGGKLSDLPPPPPSENPDYVQCPHCSRRFNQSAAERHIPKCANYQFNKPKPAAKRR
ncbi:zinc finger C2HC domain-containing protein 1C isoform X2 [Achroia grisella]|uniref:zinc finger C2HC domain-containing protein 1C isoform X2 n=1 Tax=Achroia grisella TaxID=688607 RepID=UPI0027D2F41B|nr:zinc finger C2HC domain-containing protein 1C isoform X2 [Achroia grisella]